MHRAGVTRRPRETAADIHRLLAFYRETTYRVVLPDGAGAALRIGATLPAAVVDWIGTEGDAVYLTACNPYSRPLDATANAARNAQLRAVLEAGRYRWLEGRGEAPDGAWAEPSLLVAAMTDPILDRLARRFGQNAALMIRAGASPRLRVFRAAWKRAIVIGDGVDRA